MNANPELLTLKDPLSMGDAREASRQLALTRRATETELERQTVVAADKEFVYRRRLAEEIIKAEGPVPVREATAKAEASREARDRDIAQGMVRVLQERLRGLEGERAMLRALVDWSMRELDRQQPTGETFGGKRAA